MNRSNPTSSNTQPSYWDERYAHPAYAYGTQPNAFLEQSVPSAHRPRAKALCLADGEGRNGTYLAQLGYEVTSIDFSAVAKEKALSLAKMRSVSLHYELIDLNTYELEENQWDLIACIFYQPIPLVRQQHLQRVFHSLRSQGLFVLETKASSDAKERARYPGVQELTLELSPLEVIYSLESDQLLNEGTYHQGLQRTARILGKKP